MSLTVIVKPIRWTGVYKIKNGRFKNSSGEWESAMKIAPSIFYELEFKVDDDRCAGASWELQLSPPEVECAINHENPSLEVSTSSSIQRSRGRGGVLLLQGIHAGAQFRVCSDVLDILSCKLCNPVILNIKYFPCDGRAPFIKNIPLFLCI